MLKTKKQRASDFLAQYAEVFSCPICQSDMHYQEGLECQHHHRFDLSKKGSLYFLQRQFATDYNQQMFQARRRMIERGLYQPVLAKIGEYLPSHNYRLIDIGCGEGSFSNALLKDEGVHIGFDLSKDGIQMATDYLQDNQWFCVADLTHLPFKDQSIDVILDLFSPSHYGEFKRVLQDDGYVIKGIPGQYYLKELRQAFYEGTDKEEYSNQAVKERFEKEMDVVATEHLYYEVPILEDWQEDVRLMSPIHWSASDETLLNSDIKTLTIDVELQIGKKFKL